MSLARELFRRKPVAPPAPSPGGLTRGIGTFQLAMLGVGATVGTGVFFVMHEAVPLAGPAVLLSFLVAAIAAGLSAVCYAEMASAVPVSGSTYAYAYVTLGEIVAMGVAACLMLEYGVSTAASRRGGAATSTASSATCSGGTSPTRCRRGRSREIGRAHV